MSNPFTKEQVDEIINWAINPESIGLENTLKNTSSQKKLKPENTKEKKMGNIVLNTQKEIKQWSTRVGEGVVKYLLTNKGFSIEKNKTINGRNPDILTPEIVFEVKTRNWTCPGTAGEKVIGCPFKYCEVRELFNKQKLIIVAIAYQEFEMCKEGGSMQVFGEGMSENRKKIIEFFKNMNIHFLQFSEFIKMTKEELNSL